MKSSTTPFENTNTWSEDLLESYTDLKFLESFPEIWKNLNLTSTDQALDQYRFRISKYYASLIDTSSWDAFVSCPIRKQSIPLDSETDPQLPNWLQDLSLKIFGNISPWIFDAIGDAKNLATPRLTHRYENRALLHVTSLCSMYCRFCFRKTHLNDHEKTLYQNNFSAALEYLKSHTEISELILTGGDPLTLKDLFLERLISDLNKIPHLKTLRIHTRTPVTLPSRIDEKLISTLNQWNKNLVLVTHFNHLKELSDLALAKLSLLKKNGITTLNQSVLLAGINDDANVLCQMFSKLYHHGVNALYLHHPDLTPGTFHFRVSIEKGIQIYQKLSGQCEGPALPKYVLDIPGGLGKIPVNMSNFKRIETQIDAQFAAAVYAVAIPQTKRSSESKTIQYLDLSPYSAI